MPVQSSSFLAILAAIAVTGCLSTHDSMVRDGYPLPYADGFEDGCHSGHKAGGSLFDQFRKDVRRMNAETQYAQGWSDGFRQCESEEEAAQRQARMSIEQQKLNEARKRNELAEQRHLEKQVLKGVDTSGLKNLK